MSLKLSCWISLYKLPYECDPDQLMDRRSVQIWLWIINYDQLSLYPHRAELQQNIDVQPFDVTYCVYILDVFVDQESSPGVQIKRNLFVEVIWKLETSIIIFITHQKRSDFETCICGSWNLRFKISIRSSFAVSE